MNPTLGNVIASHAIQISDVTLTIQSDDQGQCRETYSVDGCVITIDSPLNDLGAESSNWLVDRLALCRAGMAAELGTLL